MNTTHPVIDSANVDLPTGNGQHAKIVESIESTAEQNRTYNVEPSDGGISENNLAHPENGTMNN
jgi:hypothetical protein